MHGTSIMTPTCINPSLIVASGSWGCSIVHEYLYFQLQLLQSLLSWASVKTAPKVIVPVIPLTVWGPHWAGNIQCLCVNIDRAPILGG